MAGIHFSISRSVRNYPSGLWQASLRCWASTVCCDEFNGGEAHGLQDGLANTKRPARFETWARTTRWACELTRRYMTSREKHISVCICTFQRPGLLRRLLDRLQQQQTNGQFTFSVVVTDNDSAQSSQRVVADFAGSSGRAVKYSCEP